VLDVLTWWRRPRWDGRLGGGKLQGSFFLAGKMDGIYCVPSGKHKKLLKMAIYSGFFH